MCSISQQNTVKCLGRRSSSSRLDFGGFQAQAGYMPTCRPTCQQNTVKWQQEAAMGTWERPGVACSSHPVPSPFPGPRCSPPLLPSLLLRPRVDPSSVHHRLLTCGYHHGEHPPCQAPEMMWRSALSTCFAARGAISRRHQWLRSAWRAPFHVVAGACRGFRFSVSRLWLTVHGALHSPKP